MGSRPRSSRSHRPGWQRRPGSPVEAPTLEQIGVGIGVSSALYRAQLTGPGCPATVVVKLPGPRRGGGVHLDRPAHVHPGGRLLQRAGGQAPVRVPGATTTRSTTRASEFVLVMEDLGHLRVGRSDRGDGDRRRRAGGRRPGRLARHLVGAGAGARRAAAHGEPRRRRSTRPSCRWCSPRGGRSSTPSSRSPTAVQAGGPLGGPPPSRPARRARRGADHDDHGDYRADNLFFDADGSVAALDFQLIGTGRGTYDLAYFITQSLEPGRRLRARAGACSTAGAAGLVRRRGVPAAGHLDAAWEDYRQAALFCLVYPVVAWRGMDVGDPRQSRPGHDHDGPVRAGGGRAGPHRPAVGPGGWRIRRAGAYAGNPQPPRESSLTRPTL